MMTMGESTDFFVKEIETLMAEIQEEKELLGQMLTKAALFFDADLAVIVKKNNDTFLPYFAGENMSLDEIDKVRSHSYFHRIPLVVLGYKTFYIDLLYKDSKDSFNFSSPWEDKICLYFSIIINRITFFNGEALLHEDDRNEFIWESEKMGSIYQQSLKMAKADSPVLISGESGTGKEVLANYIHSKSLRSSKPLVSINCAAIPDDLLEAELFGYKRGAFTGAEKDYKGKFLQAHRGTLFLDEIGELPLAAQSKLLRVLESKKLMPLGGQEEVELDVRIIAATNQQLEQCIREGTFRKDLYFRIHVLPIKIPPLKERPEDILPLANHFIGKFSLTDYKPKLSTRAIESLLSYHWPGNVRELANVIQRAVVVSSGNYLRQSELSLPVSIDKTEDNNQDKTLKKALNSFKKKYLEHMLDTHGGNQTETAAVLGIQRTYLSRLIKELGINP